MNAVNNALVNSYMIDPLESVYDTIYFEDGSHYMDDVIEEATSTPVKKKNVLHRILDAIRKLFHWVIDRLKQFGNWLKRMFSKGNKTADQCLENAYKKSGSTKPKTNSNPKSTLRFEPTSTDGSPDSQPTDIKLVAKQLKVSLDGAKTQITFQYVVDNSDRQNPMAGSNLTKGIPDGVVPNQGATQLGVQYLGTVFRIMGDKSLFQALEEVVGSIDHLDMSDGVNLVAAIGRTKRIISANSPIDQITLSYDDINKFTQLMIRANTAMDKFYDVSVKTDDALHQYASSAKDNQLLLEFLNDFADLLRNFQFALNIITGALNDVYSVDARYEGTVDDKETLANFADECLHGGIPPKYIAWNIWGLASPRLRGNSDRRDPSMGQGRLTLVPDKDPCVFKIALNALGLAACKNEISISSILEKNSTKKIAAYVKQIYAGGVAYDMEKAKTIPKAQEGDFNKYHNGDLDRVRNALNDVLAKAGIDRQITDIHAANVGYINGKLMAIDYATDNTRPSRI